MRRLFEHVKNIDVAELASEFLKQDEWASKNAKEKDVIEIINGLLACGDEVKDPTHVIFEFEVKVNDFCEAVYYALVINPLMKDDEIVVHRLYELLPSTLMNSLVSERFDSEKAIEPLLFDILHDELVFAYLMEHTAKKEEYTVEEIVDPGYKNISTCPDDNNGDATISKENTISYLNAVISTVEEIKEFFELE